MRVFVTGATGFIGSAVVQELIQAGHQVLGLSRSDAGAKALIAAGAQVHRGSLTDLSSLQSGASASDGVIHLAFSHTFPEFLSANKNDKRAIEAIGSVLAGTTKPFIVTGGTAVVRPGVLLTEDYSPPKYSSLIRKSEETALALVSQGVKASVIRLAPTVHGDGDHAFIASLIVAARKKGVSTYIGNGLNVWPAVHRLDAARLFRLALEKGSAGAKYHGVADEGIPFKDIAQLIGRRLNLPVVSKSFLGAFLQFGWLAFIAGIDSPASSTLTQQRLEWHPEHPSLFEDLEDGSYFNGR